MTERKLYAGGRVSAGRKVCAALALAALLAAPGCARQPRTVDQVAGPLAPLDLHVGRTPPGGPSESPTGAGAGGSGAAGYEAGRVAGQNAAPVTDVKPPGFMAPVGTSGSGLGDSGHPIPPTQPIVPANSDGVTQPISEQPTQLPVNVQK